MLIRNAVIQFMTLNQRSLSGERVFDLIDGRVKVTEHRAQTRRCAACGTTTKATELPVTFQPSQPVQPTSPYLDRVVEIVLAVR